ncbi:MAG: hypothetical protein ACE5LC_09700 [Candidatus Aminicenantales bacterium]
MKLKKSFISKAALVSFFILIFILALLPFSSLARKQTAIAPKIAEIFDRDAAARNELHDIPLNLAGNLYFPAQEDSLYSIFLLKVKNRDMGFKEKEETPETLATRIHVFLRFYSMNKSEIENVVKEVYIPYSAEEKKEGFELDEENLYTIGYPLPPDHYLLALAFASDDLSRVSTIYYEFTLPGRTSYSKKLVTSPLFFYHSIKETSEPEVRVRVHKGYFPYGYLKIHPRPDNIFSEGENLNLFFFVFGASPDPASRSVKLKVTYAIKKEGEVITKFPTQNIYSPLIDQPIPPISQNEYLQEGKYALNIKIEDEVSNKSLEEELEFVVK